MEESKTTKNTYEYAFLLKIGADVSELKNLLTSLGVTIVSEGPVNQIQLAYPVKKQGSAQFGYFTITVDQASEEDPLQTVAKQTELSDFVLRTLVIKPAKEPKPKKEKDGPRVARRKNQKEEEILPKVDRIETLSNKKLEETLEEILK